MRRRSVCKEALRSSTVPASAGSSISYWTRRLAGAGSSRWSTTLRAIAYGWWLTLLWGLRIARERDCAAAEQLRLPTVIVSDNVIEQSGMLIPADRRSVLSSSITSCAVSRDRSGLWRASTAASRRMPNATIFPSLAQARALLVAWRHDYIYHRPHSSQSNINAAKSVVDLVGCQPAPMLSRRSKASILCRLDQ